MREVHKFGEVPGYPSPNIILVGNKTDLREKRVVTLLEAKKLATKHKITYRETSAATGEGVDKLFQVVDHKHDNQFSHKELLQDLLEQIVSRKRIAFQTKIIKSGSKHFGKPTTKHQ